MAEAKSFYPIQGTYITFSIDVESTFDMHRCDMNDETVGALKRFWCRKYVGFVSRVSRVHSTSFAKRTIDLTTYNSTLTTRTHRVSGPG